MEKIGRIRKRLGNFKIILHLFFRRRPLATFKLGHGREKIAICQYDKECALHGLMCTCCQSQTVEVDRKNTISEKGANQDWGPYCACQDLETPSFPLLRSCVVRNVLIVRRSATRSRNACPDADSSALIASSLKSNKALP